MTREHFDKMISEIKVEEIPIEEVEKLSLENKHLFYESRNRFDVLSESAPEYTRERWAVNYIRHHLTDYDERLWDAKGEVGIREEYSRCKAAVLDAISDAYPTLRDECQRQKVPALNRQVMDRAGHL